VEGRATITYGDVMQIERDQDKCNYCMLCVRDCITGVWQDVEGVPTPGRPELCNLCSHCVAVCPVDAIIHKGLPDNGELAAVSRDMLDPDVYREVVKTRRSIREYKQKQVSVETVESIIDLARFSPTASNSQHVEYIVVTDPNILQTVSEHVFLFGENLYKWYNSGLGRALFRIFGNIGAVKKLSGYMNAMDYYIERHREGKDYILHNAPVLILVCAPSGETFGVDNCNIAASNIMNYSHALGLGTCCIGFLTVMLKYSRKLRKLLQLPNNRTVHASLVLGYPAYSHKYDVQRQLPRTTWLE